MESASNDVILRYILARKPSFHTNMPTTRLQSKGGTTTKASPARAKPGRKRGIKEVLKKTNKDPVAVKSDGEDLDKKKDGPPTKRQKVEDEENEKAPSGYNPGMSLFLPSSSLDC